ncbi:MAG: hypothetical protein M3Z24_12865, partial [Chloroflexota bacterium]|nr:hypothetical protein [Chloroflexota bacterium]
MRTVQRNYTIIRRRSFFLIVPLTLLLAFLCTACGTNTGTTGTGSSSGATPTPTAIQGYGAAYGCPSDAVVNTAPSKANVTLTVQNSSLTTSAHTGDVVEIDVPFGQQWSGPKTSQGNLQLQSPAGYAWKESKMCVWRFVAQTTGTTQLT